MDKQAYNDKKEKIIQFLLEFFVIFILIVCCIIIIPMSFISYNFTKFKTKLKNYYRNLRK